jgi:hypothetical protein
MTKKPPKQERPRNIANDMLDAVETATSKWTRQSIRARSAIGPRA